MNHLDLFSGIGGFGLAARWAGLKTTAFCEIDSYCQKVLNKHWPDVPIYDDIREFGKERLENDGISTDVDFLTGGFPCQPFSVAGRQKGQDDNRHLWPEMLRIISEIRPNWIIGENVSGFISLALDDCLADLESQGYKTETFVLPACAVNAPHRRDRVWIVGHAEELSSYERKYDRTDGLEVRGGKTLKFRGADSPANVANTGCQLRARAEFSRANGLENKEQNADLDQRSSTPPRKNVADSQRIVAHAKHDGSSAPKISREFDPPSHQKQSRSNQAIELERAGQSWHSENVEGTKRSSTPSRKNVADSDSPRFKEQRLRISTEKEYQASECGSFWATEPNVGRVADGVPSRVDRLKGLGNAVVPQIPYQLMMMIKQLNPAIRGQ